MQRQNLTSFTKLWKLPMMIAIMNTDLKVGKLTAIVRRHIEIDFRIDLRCKFKLVKCF